MLSVKVNFNSLVKVLKILTGIQPIQTFLINRGY